MGGSCLDPGQVRIQGLARRNGCSEGGGGAVVSILQGRTPLGAGVGLCGQGKIWSRN